MSELQGLGVAVAVIHVECMEAVAAPEGDCLSVEGLASKIIFCMWHVCWSLISHKLSRSPGKASKCKLNAFFKKVYNRKNICRKNITINMLANK